MQPKLIFKSNELANGVVGVLKISDNTRFLEGYIALDQSLHRSIKEITNTKRKNEVALTLMLINELVGTEDISVAYTEMGKPYFKKSSKKVSISHTKDFIAVIIDENEVGIDIQFIDPKIERIYKKFMSEEELGQVERGNLIQQLCVYWCAKEALFKLHGMKGVDFKKNLMIEPFEFAHEGIIIGNVTFENEKSKHKLWYQKVELDNMLVYVLND